MMSDEATMTKECHQHEAEADDGRYSGVRSRFRFRHAFVVRALSFAIHFCA
jgi:hypothetical protein